VRAIYNYWVKTDADTYILLWGGPLAPSSARRVLYWAVNGRGALCGIILPAETWGYIEQVFSSPTELDSPYLSVAVSGLSTETPEVRLVTLDADTLYDFCYLKNAIYRLRQAPAEAKIDPDKLMGHLGLAEVPPLVTLKRFGLKPDKGEFFTFMPDKERVELFYLIGPEEAPPQKLGVQVLWGLKGFGLPVVAKGTGYTPQGSEKAMLGRSAVKPLPFWLRQFSRFFKRRRQSRA